MRSRRRVADGDAEKALCGAMVASIACYMRLGLTVYAPVLARVSWCPDVRP